MWEVDERSRQAFSGPDLQKFSPLICDREIGRGGTCGAVDGSEKSIGKRLLRGGVTGKPQEIKESSKQAQKKNRVFPPLT